MTDTTVYIALGSNLGDRRDNLIDAVSQLRQNVLVEQISAVYETEPAYVTDQPSFYNMVLQGQTEPTIRYDSLALISNAVNRTSQQVRQVFNLEPQHDVSIRRCHHVRFRRGLRGDD